MDTPILALCAHPSEVSAVHYLSAPQVKRVAAASPRALSGLFDASAVIFSRNLFAAAPLLRAAQDISIPRYYFLDENVLTMREEPHHHTHCFYDHSEDALRTQLQGFSGVLASEPRLVDYLRARKIHHCVEDLPPAISGLPVRSAMQALEKLEYSQSRVVRVAYFSAPTRQGFFAQFVLPALRNLAHTHNIELIAFGCAPKSLDDPASPLRVRTPKWEPDYNKALTTLEAWNPEILLQPDFETLSTPYRLPHIIFSAAKVGASLVASRISPYTTLADQAQPPVMLADNTRQSWEESIRLLLASPSLRVRLANNAISYVQRASSVAANRQVIAGLMQKHAPPNRAARSSRATLLEPHLDALNHSIATLVGQQRGVIHQQAQAIERYKSDVAEIEASLEDGRQFLKSATAASPPCSL